MIEPTETESRETLDAFVEAMTRIRAEMEEDPEKLHQAPTRTPVRRIDEVRAAKQPVLRWKPEQQPASPPAQQAPSGQQAPSTQQAPPGQQAPPQYGREGSHA